MLDFSGIGGGNEKGKPRVTLGRHVIPTLSEYVVPFADGGRHHGAKPRILKECVRIAGLPKVS